MYGRGFKVFQTLNDDTLQMIFDFGGEMYT